MGVAPTGKIALQKLTQNQVDLVILDLEMPEMSGKELLAELRKKAIYPKIIVFSSYSQRGAEVTLDALRLGASDFVPKPSGDIPEDQPRDPKDRIRVLLSDKILNLFEIEPAKPIHKYTPSIETHKKEETPTPTAPWTPIYPKAIVIGSSTGGPSALEDIFSRISAPVSCPIFIVQHMPPLFTATLAERLQKISGIPAAEGKHNEFAQPNRIYIAPGDFHMRLVQGTEGVLITLNQDPLEHSVRPAVDQLFVSAAKIFKSSLFGIVLSGMGQDGLIGATEIRSSGGKVMIQNKESCVVFGMPGAIFAAGAYDKIGDLQVISQTISEAVGDMIQPLSEMNGGSK